MTDSTSDDSQSRLCEVCGENYVEDYEQLAVGESYPATRLCVIDDSGDSVDCRVHLAEDGGRDE